MAGEMNADHWIERLGLELHPEGGFYRETYRSKGVVKAVKWRHPPDDLSET